MTPTIDILIAADLVALGVVIVLWGCYVSH